MNILKGKYGPKSRITGLPMDNSHPNTSNLTRWTRFRVRSKQWAAMNLHDIDGTKGLLRHLSLFGHSVNDSEKLVLEYLSNHIMTEFRLGRRHPLRRMAHIKKVADLMKINGSNTKFMDEVFYTVWPDPHLQLQSKSIWSKD